MFLRKKACLCFEKCKHSYHFNDFFFWKIIIRCWKIKMLSKFLISKTNYFRQLHSPAVNGSLLISSNRQFHFFNQTIYPFPKLIDHPVNRSSFYLKHLNNNLRNNAAIIMVIRRDFKARNVFYDSRPKFLIGYILEWFIKIIIFVVIINTMFDFKNIWNYLVPDNLKKFVKKIEDEIKTLDKDIKKTFKRADSLAASVPEQKRSDISGKDDGIVEPEQQLMAKTDLFANIKDQLMAVFNYNYDNQRPDGFRNKRIIEYENRIRSYSNPDKIFRYFATIKIVHVNQEVEIFMTPHDFLRALTPGIRQPDGYGLDQFEVIDLSKVN